MGEGRIGLKTLGVSCIACEEEESLARMAASMWPVATEMVIGVDRKSADETLRVAQEIVDAWNADRYHRGVLYEFDFTTFDEVRNQNLDRCTSDFVMTLDGHEFLLPNSQFSLRRILDKNLDGYDVLLVLLLLSPGSQYSDSLFSARVFPNSPNMRYVNPVHATPRRLDAPMRSLPDWDVQIGHDSPARHEAFRAKHRRELHKLFERRLEEDPNDQMSLFYLTKFHSGVGERDIAEGYFHRLCRVDDPDPQFIHGLHIMFGLMVGRDGDRAKARDHFHAAIRACPSLSDPYVELAKTEMAEEHWDTACHWWRAATICRVPNTNQVFSPSAYTWLPWAGLAEAHVKQQQWTEASRAYRKMLAFDSCPDDVAQRLEAVEEEARKNLTGTMSIALVDTQGSFSKDMEAHWKALGHEVQRMKQYDKRQALQADLVWCDWADTNLMEASNAAYGQGVVARLHGYEIFNGEFVKMFREAVAWDKVYALVVVSKHMKRVVYDRIGDVLKDQTKLLVVPNGVDMAKYTFRHHSPGPNVAFVCGLNPYVKGMHFLPMYLRALVERDPNAVIHIACPTEVFAHSDVGVAVQEEVRTLNLDGHLVGDGWQEDVNAWLEDKDWFLSLSIRESFGYALAEAMTKGIKPLILNRPGAVEMWPEECVFHDPGGMKDIMDRDYLSGRYREWVEERYPLQRQLDALTKIAHEAAGIPEPKPKG